jgi:phosphoribosylaminoimidazolecarboxamide formyltransferase/IMP cyclohydrolase
MNFVEVVDDAVPIRQALISVYDKRGLEELVRGLVRVNPELRIYSTGGSYSALRDILGADGRLRQVAEYTGQPEMQGGLVKTLDFKIYLGLLSETYNPAHQADLDRVQAVPIDLVVVNLYPFAQVVSQPDVTPEKARANIDIGGPCLVRAAAKNFLRVAAVVDPADYPGLLAELQASGGTLSLAARFRLAQKAFAATAEYDRLIAGYLGGCRPEQAGAVYAQVRNRSAS